jgi:ferredoxin
VKGLSDMGTTIFYFTGTGNSMMIARDLAAQLGNGTEITSIPQAIHKEIVLSSECIGFIMPVYFWGMPLMVEDFIKKLAMGKAKYIFAVVTFGGKPGSTLYQIDDLLKQKGVELSAGFEIQLPENYIPLYNLPSPAEQENQIKNGKIKIREIAEMISSRQKHEINQDSTGFIIRILSVLFHKRSAKFHKDAAKFWVTEKCNDCGTCKLICPVQNIRLDDGRPRWGNKCEQCLACIHWCPTQAIEFGEKTLNRKRYRNPELRLQDIINAAAGKCL